MCVNPSDFEFSPIVAEGAEQEKRAGRRRIWYMFGTYFGR